MSCFIGGRMIDNDVLVRRNRQPNVDLKSGAMAMLVAWSYNGNTASRYALIVCFQSFDLFQYHLARSRRWLRTFEGNFWVDLHFGPSDVSMIPCQSACSRMVAAGNVRS
jgi:hypothetical protein